MIVLISLIVFFLAVVGGRFALRMAQSSRAERPPFSSSRVALILLSYILIGLSLAILIVARPAAGTLPQLVSSALALAAIASFAASMSKKQ